MQPGFQVSFQRWIRSRDFILLSLEDQGILGLDNRFVKRSCKREKIAFVPGGHGEPGDIRHEGYFRDGLDNMNRQAVERDQLADFFGELFINLFGLQGGAYDAADFSEDQGSPLRDTIIETGIPLSVNLLITSFPSGLIPPTGPPSTDNFNVNITCLC